ncbi:hypothetical protein ACQP2P_43830 [Dactylosporangium sp. CA-139114]|uniref:hypothetical protein n=1 Tax=Dactylosporangium sp. CA-139114 TaxID=3239931 RepID=UPI003D996CB0
MPQWAQGADKVRELLDLGDLQKIQGADTDGQPLLDKAVRTLLSAAVLCDEDPDSSYTLAYDAARFACTALLAQQGLRPTSKGGHYAVEQAMRAQFQGHFRGFGTLRRRRNELEYPSAQEVATTPAEARDAHIEARSIVEAAGKLMPHLSFF